MAVTRVGGDEVELLLKRMSAQEDHIRFVQVPSPPPMGLKPCCIRVLFALLYYFVAMKQCRMTLTQSQIRFC